MLPEHAHRPGEISGWVAAAAFARSASTRQSQAMAAVTHAGRSRQSAAPARPGYRESRECAHLAGIVLKRFPNAIVLDQLARPCAHLSHAHTSGTRGQST